MLGFTKKRFFITLAIGITVWIISGIMQFFMGEGVRGAYIIGSSCDLTGYPVAKCIPSSKFSELILTYAVNIIFWFWVVHVIWGFARRSKS